MSLCTLLALSGMASQASGTAATEGSDTTVVTGSPRFDVGNGDGPSDWALRETVRTLRQGDAVPDQIQLDAQNRLTIEVIHSAEVSVDEVIISMGGSVIDTAFGLTLATLPAGSIVDLENRPSVDHVRLPLTIDIVPENPPAESNDLGLQAIVGEAVQKTRVGPWHAAGFEGSGIRIGVIDSFGLEEWAAAQGAGEVPSPAGTFCRFNGVNCSIWQGGTHGVAVAEILHDMAPGAELYLVTAPTTTDLSAAIDYLIDQDVDIITRSLGSRYDGPGDGSGRHALIQQKAVDAGIIWFNSAGNHAASGSPNGTVGAQDGGHWKGTWSDPDANGFLNFNGGGEIMEMGCGLFQGLRWDDFASANPTDYAIYLWDDGPPFTVETAFVYDNRQAGGASPPIEHFPDSFRCNEGPDIDYIAIGLHAIGNGATGDTLQVAVNTAIDPWNNPYSATQPFADTRSAGGVAVGAIDPAKGTDIAVYSSRGPTNDGRTKPDISAAACLQTFTPFQSGCFNGTSSATPVVAGAAAVIKSSGLATTPAAIKNFLLRQATVDRGPSGADNTFGVGELILPSPPVDSSPPTWASTARLQASDSGERGLTLTWPAATDNKGVAGYRLYQAPGTPDSDGFYQGVRIAETNASTRSRSIDGLTPGQEYAFWVEAFDLADNESSDGPLAVLRTATDFRDTNTNVFHDDIAWLSATGITQGCNPPVNDRFCPEAPVTRQQMASFLVRALGLIGGENRSFFEDIGGSVHQIDINRLAYWEITAGCNPSAVPPNTRFCPGQAVTRAQMASFLTRSFGLSDGWNEDYFRDDDTSVHEFDINRLAHSNITKGCNPPQNSIFCPGQPVTRGQMAAFMHRARAQINEFRQLVGAELLPAEATQLPLQKLAPEGGKASNR